MFNAALMSKYNYRVLPDGTCRILSPKDKYETKYVIPEGVSSIAPHAFSTDDSILEEVVLPESLKSIDEEAFLNCRKLTKINIPSALTYIGENAFSHCNLKFSKLEIPRGVKELLEGTFSGSEIDELFIPSSVRFGINYSTGAFAYAEINKLVIEEGTSSIGYNAFQNAKIREVIIPSSMNSIDDECFFGSKIDKLVINEGIKHIGGSVFEDAFLPKVVILPKSLVSIGDDLFESVENTEVIVYDGNVNFPSGGAKVLSQSEYNKLCKKESVTEAERKTSVDLSRLFNKTSPAEQVDRDQAEAKKNVAEGNGNASPVNCKEREPIEKKYKFKAGITTDEELKKRWPDRKIGLHDDRRKGIRLYSFRKGAHVEKGYREYDYLVGLESDHPIESLDLSSINRLGFFAIVGDCLSGMGIKSITLPKGTIHYDLFEALEVKGENWRRAFDIETVIIPKEVKSFSIKKEHLGAVKAIKFESPKGWGVKKEIISDPVKMCEYIRCREETNLKKSFLNSIKSLFGVEKE